ncbi:MAG: EF-hand domain-containing protein [Gammaproteobacteria bacterium]|nr:EF-hand domain-containing protein [Gammaproteobacteria bacterium]
MKNTPMILAACAALLFSTAALAEPKEFPKADANGDGKVDMAEFAKSGFEDKKFEEVDTDKNGIISKEEYTTALEECD